MRRVLSIIGLSVILLLVFTTIGCSRATRIGDILADPSQYEGKDLTIRGTVGETGWLTLVEKGAYQLGDSSGTIWVITSQPPPQKEQSISTKGKVQSAFSIAGQSYGTVLVETQRD
ncbi:MAG: hypothetical protein C4555_04900 [Dehalococcoidia bacterium]|nr:MAG: hypothetical protein C4555_04900 [Dehalococcoidia bacterium]